MEGPARFASGLAVRSEIKDGFKVFDLRNGVNKIASY